MIAGVYKVDKLYELYRKISGGISKAWQVNAKSGISTPCDGVCPVYG